MTPADTLNLGLSAALGGVGLAFVLAVLGGFVFWAIELLSNLWGRG